MTIERRETRFIIPAETAPGDIDDLETTSPRVRSTSVRDRRHTTNGRSTRVRPVRFVAPDGMDPFAPRGAGGSNATVTAPAPREQSPVTDGRDSTPQRSRVETSASPRATPVLERRRLWERGYRTRVRVTDGVVIGLVTLVPRGIELALGSGASLAGDMWGILNAFATPLLVALSWALMLAVFRTRETGVFGSGSAEYKRVLNATTFTFGALAMLYAVLELSGLRSELLITLPVGTLMLMIGRWGWRRWLLRERLFGHYVSRTFVVGDRADVEYVIETLHRDDHRGYLVVGATLSAGDASELSVDGQTYPVVGSPRSAARTAARLGADTIIVASHDDADPYFIKRLSWQLEGTAAELVLSSRLTDVAGPRISLRQVDGLPLIQVKIPSFEGVQYAMKRTFDIVVSSLAIAAIALISIPLAIMIKLDSRGPVFFHQERVGRDGHRFKMLKFRTMRVGAEAELAALAAANDGAGPLFKMRADPRVTRVGAILRKLSLDELPQFWNVLRGDMSVVGPRPPLPSEVTAYNGAVFRRLYIKPGITGLWQVSGRSDLPWDESVRLDLRYVENWSIMSDVTIMWRTVRTMLAPQGAY